MGNSSGNTITREGDMIKVMMHVDTVHGLRVALQSCSCIAAKSSATRAVAERFDKGLARAVAGKLAQ